MALYKTNKGSVTEWPLACHHPQKTLCYRAIVRYYLEYVIHLTPQDKT